MDITSVLGFIIAAAAIYFGAPDLRNELHAYLDLDSFILVFIGSIACVIIASTAKEVKLLIKLILGTLKRKKRVKPHEALNIIMNIAKESQGNSKQEIPNIIKNQEISFLNLTAEMIESDLNADFIEKTLDNHIIETESQNTLLANKIRSIGAYATMFGMAGTVMGVIQVLRDVKDVNNIITGLSLALLTTLYGLFLSSIFYLPISKKLHNQSEKEVIIGNIYKDGILMILNKEIPLKIKYYLLGYIEQEEKKNAK